MTVNGSSFLAFDAGIDWAVEAITWSSGVTTSMKTDVSMKTLIGRGSGESLQMAFGGTGWVLV